MSSTGNLQQKILSSMVQYLVIGIGLYFIALLLGTIIKVLFNITFISYQGIQVDIVTYIGYGAIDLLLTVLQLFGTAIIVMLVWLYNAFVVDFFFRWFLDGVFHIILQVHIFANIPHISDATVLQLAEAIAIIKDIFSITAWDILKTGSDFAEDIVRLGGGTQTR